MAQYTYIIGMALTGLLMFSVGLVLARRERAEQSEVVIRETPVAAIEALMRELARSSLAKSEPKGGFGRPAEGERRSQHP